MIQGGDFTKGDGTGGNMKFLYVAPGQCSCVIMSTPLGGGHIIFAFSGVRTLGFRSFEGKVFILSLPNLVWVFIGLIACMGLLLVKIGL